MINFFRRHFHLLVAGLLLVMFAMFSLLSEGYFGGADNISHYFISHFAFKYPAHFLDAWGRPLYTMVSAPFALFGLQGAKLLNVLLGISTAWFTFRITQILNLRPAVLAMVFVCFTPLYFVMMPTALTEILFSFVIIFSIFLFLRKNYLAAAIVISFIPFARTEGYIMLPLFMIAFFRAGKAKVIPFLATGIIVFSVAGGLYFKDMFWLINRFPYPVTYTHPIYHNIGSLWHFLERRELILGLPLEILFIAGIAGMTRDLVSKDHSKRQNTLLFFLVLFIPFAVYLAFHSFLFWKAMGGSMGLERVMAAVLPLAAIISMKGFNDLAAMFRASRVLYVTFLIISLGAVIITPFLTYSIPTRLSPEEETVRRATTWLKTSPYAGRLFFFTDINVPYYMNADPYRKNPAECYLFGDCKYLDTIPAGSLLIWDAHFGANESKIPIDSLLGNHRQKVIGYFRPAEPWITLGGGWYDCYVTVTMEPGEQADNYAIRDSLQEILDAKNGYKLLYLNTFENPGDAWNPSYLSADTVHRGERSYRMDHRTEYSPGYTRPVNAMPPASAGQELQVSLYVFFPRVIPGMNTLLVLSFENRDKPYSYSAVNLNDIGLQAGRWRRVTIKALIPEFFSPKDMVKAYLWNPGKQLFLFDDFRVNLLRPGGSPAP
ncbi:MAG: hypothetical protein Q8M08_01870 [Bacteroidales bacterium]|nr:hypothetical protein [Bacteroidales bacterium]